MTQQMISVEEDQDVYVRLGTTSYLLHLYAFRGLMYYDLVVADETVISGQRVMSWLWLVPKYRAEGEGNFRFEVYKADGNDYVWWEDFNTKFRLCVYGADEMEEA